MQSSPSSRGPTRVVVVDDSALIRRLLSDIINRERDMQVVGAAPDPFVARDMIRALDPDVVTLDVEMPKMDGLDFLEKLMRLRPMPVVMVSTLTQRGSEAALRALELGAIDFVAKPKLDIEQGVRELGAEIVERIRVAAKVRMRRPVPGAAPPPRLAAVGNRASTEKLVFVGASTGGTEALREMLVRMPPDIPAILVTQHMPPGFTRTFAARLNELCKMDVSEAVDGERLLPGHAYIAPGGLHLQVGRSGANYIAKLDDGPPVNRHKPSVEVLFRSAAEVAGRNAIGVMLTGMGKDGAVAMRAMREAGAYNVAQDEASCVVFGMPKEAIAEGGVQTVLPLRDIAPHIVEHLVRFGGRSNRV
ncbi:MAG: chemotaxis response regulator protein-glutamate methylesterase [Burkholderiales bacterium]